MQSDITGWVFPLEDLGYIKGLLRRNGVVLIKVFLYI